MRTSDLDAWAELWHACKDVVIVGHRAEDVCPYRVGHSLHEHIIAVDAKKVIARFRAMIASGRHVR